jgi:hypothetical protein
MVRFGGDEHKARAVWKMKTSYNKVEQHRTAKRIKLIDMNDIPNRPAAISGKPSGQTATCKAITLGGQPCKFKATCGKFCKKHTI